MAWPPFSRICPQSLYRICPTNRPTIPICWLSRLVGPSLRMGALLGLSCVLGYWTWTRTSHTTTHARRWNWAGWSSPRLHRRLLPVFSLLLAYYQLSRMCKKWGIFLLRLLSATANSTPNPWFLLGHMASNSCLVTTGNKSTLWWLLWRAWIRFHLIYQLVSLAWANSWLSWGWSSRGSKWARKRERISGFSKIWVWKCILQDIKKEIMHFPCFGSHLGIINRKWDHDFFIFNFSV